MLKPADDASGTHPRFFQDPVRAFNMGEAFIKHVGCGNNSLLTVACIRAIPTDKLFNYLVEFPRQLDIPPGTPVPLLLPVMEWGPVRLSSY